ncbi:replication protein P [Testudinibacter sp. TR-2022]|uniref:replication protein P n=1 Tax=Testudinibacter sp. TR-2022 TaxID=2585029 RepID=UPI00159BC1C9|nr:replication protein P [Testudinibacter sp. TR-2022]
MHCQTLPDHVAAMADQLFARLCVYFPAWRNAFPTPEALEQAKAIWIDELVAAGVVRFEQIQRGLLVAKKQQGDFFPSLTDFIAWCDNGGLPTVEEVEAAFHRYCGNRLMFNKPHFTHAEKVMYWIVTGVHQRKPLEVDLKRVIKAEIKKVAERLHNLPEPRTMLPSPPPQKPLSQEEKLDRLAGMRAMLRGAVA